MSPTAIPTGAVNETCPWSGKPVSPDSLTLHQGHVVGFCNTGCRNKFEAAVAHFDTAIAGLPRPSTLLQFAGARIGPARLSEAVLVVVDAQAEYTTGSLRLDGVDAALRTIGRLLERARRVGTPIIHVVQRGRAGGLFDPAGPGWPVDATAVPREGEAVVEKTLPNAFAGTDLHARLRELGRPHVMLVGFATHMCVSATARAGLDLGHAVTVIADATATRALPGVLGGPPLAGQAVHAAALAELADRFAAVVAENQVED